MRRLRWYAQVPVLLFAASPLSGTPLALVLKCGSGAPRAVVPFVPPPAAAAQGEVVPQMALRPGLTGWRIEDRSDLPLVPPPPRMPVIYILDGRIVEEDAFQRTSADEIDSIIITCSEAYHTRLGIEEGNTLIVAFSRGGSLALLRKEMKTIEAMQTGFVAAHGRFARSLDELGWKPAEDAWVVELTAADDGASWSAVARHLLLDDRHTITVSGAR